MQNAKDILDQYFLEMRWRCLSLAADLDRVERAGDGPSVLQSDSRVQNLLKALEVLRSGKSNRAEQVQMIFSDLSAPPARQRM